MELNEAIELSSIKVIGAKCKHFSNSSKGYQLTHSIRKAIKNNPQDSNIRLPNSYYLQGNPDQLKKLLRKHELIVKSSSYVRSKVVNQNTFLKWRSSRYLKLPTLFQEYIEGCDIRIHALHNKQWGVKIQSKSDVDFRYAKTRSSYKKYYLTSNIKTFISRLRILEDSELIGVDILEKSNVFYCLESNPNPGWAGFHQISGDELKIGRALLKRLAQKENG